MVGQVDLVDRPHSQPPDQVTRKRADDQLHHEIEGAHAQTAPALGVGDHADQQDRKHVGHRVVRAALQLQQRTEMLFETLLLASQDREDRRRVGRGHRGGQQQRQREGDLQIEPRSDEPDEARQHHGRHNHSHRGQHDARPDDRLYLLKGGVHTAREEDDAQCDHTDELRHFDRTERNEIQPEQHADPQKEQQRGGAEAVSDLAGHHRHEEQQRTDQYYIFTTDVYHLSNLFFRIQNSAGAVPVPERSDEPYASQAPSFSGLICNRVSGRYSRSAYSKACMAAKRLSGVRYMATETAGTRA